MQTLEVGRIKARLSKAEAWEDPVAWRLRLSSVLSGADLQPPGLPPSAVLIVRRLDDPLPGRMMPHRTSLRPERNWEQASRHALSDCYRTAVRPVRGVLPDRAEAVRFADAGELLACLALDVSQNRAHHRWWWQIVLRRLPAAARSNMAALLHERTAHLPAALHYLATWHQEEPVLRVLSHAEASTLLEAMARTFALPPFELDARPASFMTANPEHQSASSSSRPGASAPPPWQHIPLSPTASLNRTHEALLGIGLRLHQAPARVAAPAFRRALRQWWESGNVEREVPPEAADEPRLQANLDSETTALNDGQTAASFGGEAPQPLSTPSPAASSPPPFPIRPGPASPASPQEVSSARQLRVNPSVQETAPGAAPQPASPQMPGPPHKAAVPHRPEKTDIGQAFADGVATRLAGAFYLVNLMRYLGLPGCFEAGWQLESTVGPWGVLEVLARAFLGPMANSYRDDPLWTALATLDGREPRTLPGAGFQGSNTFLLPPAWHTEIAWPGPPAVHWAATRRQFCLWTAEGVVLAEAPRTVSPPSVQARETLCELSLDPRAVSLARRSMSQAPLEATELLIEEGVHANLARWMACVLPFLRHRLAAALDLDACDHPALADALLLHPGMLYCTATHIDLVLPLDAISLRVRRAGLDRDPGWLPRFGRVVLFHFH